MNKYTGLGSYEIYLLTMFFTLLGLSYSTQSISEGDTYIIYNACNIGGINGGGSNCMPGINAASPPSSIISSTETIIYDNGDRYEGELRNGMYNGKGIYISAKGHRYEGDFLNNKQHGHGLLIFANGDRYEGEFRNDKRNGYGTYVSANGSSYVGEFLNGKQHGRGVLTFANGARFEGEFRNDKRIEN